MMGANYEAELLGEGSGFVLVVGLCNTVNPFLYVADGNFQSGYRHFMVASTSNI